MALFLSRTRAIRHKRHKLLVSKNVYHALHQLRRADGKCTLRIEQVCTNQADLRERQIPVSLIGEVYTVAGRVIVWLGCADTGAVRREKLLRNPFQSTIYRKQSAKNFVPGTLPEDVSLEAPLLRLLGRQLGEHVGITLRIALREG